MNEDILPNITDAHKAFLEGQAVDIEAARRVGVFSATSVEDIPEDLRAGIGRYVPGLVFPWTSPSGRVSLQIRPDTPTTDEDGKVKKYAFRRGEVPVLWQLRATDGPLLIVEGSKPALVASSYAPPEYAVYGVAGCFGWSHDGVPISDLEVADGRDVVVIFDADASTNPQVYLAGTRLAAALRAEGAKKATWARLPAGRKAGLDDVLAARSPERRAGFLARIIADAKPKVADSKPKASGKQRSLLDEPKAPPSHGDRTAIVVNRDRLLVIGEIVDTMKARWDGTELFDHGGAISRLSKGSMHPVERGSALNLIQEAAFTVAEADGDYVPAWPDANTILAVLASAERFKPLDRVTSAPFLRPDGTVCTTPGYDEATRTFLQPSDDVAGITVPDNPSDAEVAAAVELILGDWLGDMPFPDDSSRANALALFLTPIIRGLVQLVPLAVVDGLQMGVGKNLLADCLAILVTGRDAETKPYTPDDAEHRKVILSTFRAGNELFVFDEAHVIEGVNFARALTSVYYSDRILGTSTMAEFPNMVTWVALGNQVQVRGDMARRVYRVQLKVGGGGPQDRRSEDYRHPNLKDWTHENRGRLLGACLTLVRAWVVAGRPDPSGGVWFGSFEQWQRTVGGVLDVAGVRGFLGGHKEWRSETDFESSWWASHLLWLLDKFDDVTFTAANVKSEALRDPSDYVGPPGLDDPSAKTFAKEMGRAYSRVKDRWFDGLKLVKVGADRRKVAKWVVVEDPDEADGSGVATITEPPGAGNAGIDGMAPALLPREKTSFRGVGEENTRFPVYGGAGSKPAKPVIPAPPSGGAGSGSTPLIVDLETASADQLYSYGPGFARLAGVRVGDGPVTTTTDIDGLARQVEAAPLVVGHNVMGYDLQVLARYHGLDLQALVGRGAVFDTLLAARQAFPPMAKSKGRLGLDDLGETLGLGRKVGDLKALAKEYGGYDAIPLDDERYLAYQVGDVELTAKVYEALRTDDPYVAREHRVAALAAAMSLTGFRVDVELLERRMEAIKETRGDAIAWLAKRCAIPLTDGKGEPYASPLATSAGQDALEGALTAAGATSLWRTGSGRLATSREAMVHLAHEYHYLPGVVAIVERVIQVVTARTVYHTIHEHLVGDRVHPRVSMEQATGRWSVTSPGLTVLGKRGGRYVERDVLIPDPGDAIIAVDLSQADMRAVAGLSGDQAYADMLRSEDPHLEVAISLFGDPGKRQEAKAIGHGWNYGRGVKAISEKEGIDPKIVRQFDQSMTERFPRLVEWRDEVRQFAAEGNLLDNGFGRKMQPDPQRAHTQAPALLGQSAARDIMMQGLLRLADAHPEVVPMLRAQIHDEVVLSVPREDAADISRAVVEAMSFDWKGVPIVAEASPVGDSWGAIYKK